MYFRRNIYMDKLLDKITASIKNLQWEYDRLGSDGQKEYDHLVATWDKFLKSKAVLIETPAVVTKDYGISA